MSIDEAYGLHDATGLVGLVVSNEVKVTELVEVAITRIEEQNPRLNAVVLPAFADARDRVAAGVPQGPLHGVPYLVKDLNTNVAGLPSTNGSRALRDVVPTVDSVLVGRMRDAGLVVLGKTNTPEMGMGVCTSPALRGPPPNPFDPTRSAGGSSGGSACAVASGMLPAAHATDSGGSIRIPASNCGLFGLKPTRGRVPLGNDAAEGLDGLSTSHAVTHSVRDSALLLDVTHGPSPGSPPGIATVPSSVGGFVSAIDGPLRPLRIALWTEGLADELVDETCRIAAYQAAGLAEALGCAVAEVRPPVDGWAVREALSAVFAVNVHATVAGILQVHPDGDPTDLFEPATLAAYRHGRGIGPDDHRRAVDELHRTARTMELFFEDYDILLTPTLAAPARPLGMMDMAGSYWPSYISAMLDEIPFTPLFNVTGGPAASVPLGRCSSGLPVGVQIGAAFGNEATVLRLARGFEEAAPWHDRI